MENRIKELSEVLREKSELGEVMENLDRDEIDPKTNMSSIDFNTRLSSDEINAVMVIDELVRLGILPSDIGLTRQKKRLAVSLNGKGREEKVRMTAAEREIKSAPTGLARLFHSRE